MARNLWGWGELEQAEDLRAAQMRAQAFFGELGVEAPAPPRLPAPRVGVSSKLAAFATATDAERASHAMGKSYVDRLRGFRGDFSSAPDLVARPIDEHQLETLLEVAAAEHLAVTPFGGGSSVVGGVEPLLGPGHRGAVSVDLTGLNRVLEIDEVSRVARVQAGVLGPSLEHQLAAKGLTLRHFPQSFEYSTLGGWIATRAGGHFATLYTHIDELVEAVRMVTPRGLFETRRVPASGAGPDPNRLVLGSEGTLGVITEAWVRVLPRPTHRASATFLFEDHGAAVEATRELSQSGLYPANCRLLDAPEALLNGVAADGRSVLIVSFESADHPLDGWIERAMAIAALHRGTCPNGKTTRTSQGPGDEGAADTWRRSFLRGPYLQDAMIQLGVIADTFETSCTWTAFPTLYDEVSEAMRSALARVCGQGLVTCRFTHVYPDGPAPYFTFLGRAKRGAELEQWAELKRVASDALLAAGGTITHHHAVGRTHRPWYHRERSPLFASALVAVKGALDPDGLLNPGVLL